MKKIIAALFAFVLCIGLCACDAETGLEGKPEDIVLPVKPQQMEIPGEDSENSTEATDASGETYPWEAEFIEEDYDVFQFPGQISYRIGGLFGREVRNIETLSDGLIFDRYYYPSGNLSHGYEYRPDGVFREFHCMDNGYTDENGTIYSGVCIYQKLVNPDGSWDETHWDENGTIIVDISMNPDGTYRESYYYENGNNRLTIDSNSSDGIRNETEFYESGALKYTKLQTPEMTQEERCGEEGYRTYYYAKTGDYEIELTADETGKLEKVVENGKAIEDAAALTQYAKDYNFRQ